MRTACSEGGLAGYAQSEWIIRTSANPASRGERKQFGSEGHVEIAEFCGIVAMFLAAKRTPTVDLTPH